MTLEFLKLTTLYLLLGLEDLLQGDDVFHDSAVLDPVLGTGVAAANHSAVNNYSIPAQSRGTETFTYLDR